MLEADHGCAILSLLLAHLKRRRGIPLACKAALQTQSDWKLYQYKKKSKNNA
jgi:hypothetical protein